MTGRSVQTGVLATGLALAASACGDAEGRRPGADPGLGDAGGGEDDPVVFIEEDEFGPVASYLNANANFPVPPDDDDAGGETGGEMPPPAPDEDEDDGGQACDGFSCTTGECIQAEWKCDDYIDCPGGEDEADCGGDDSGGSGEAPACDGFECNDGTCIIAEWECDDYIDCAGGEDEADCAGGGSGDGGTQTCDGFECNDGACIDETWVCDDLIDCQGGEDEAVCVRGPDGVPLAPNLSAGARAQAISGSCLATWTARGAATGVLAAEVATKGCQAGGVVVGFLSGGTGFAAAGVCFAGDVSGADTVAGGVFGALSGLTRGLVFCEGGALELATRAFTSMVETQTIPLYKVEPKEEACEPCPAPEGAPEPDRVDCVPPSKPHHPCKSHHWHVYSWEVNQNPETCECHQNKREEVLCYDPVGDPDIASDPIWDVCL